MSFSRPPSPPSPVRGARLVRVGRVAGVPIFLTPSWIFVALFVTLSYSDFLRSQVVGLSQAGAYALALAYSFLLAASVIVHELGHVLVSRAVGLTVSRVVVFLLGGVSEIEGQARRPRDDFLIAAAGPLFSFLLAAACWAGTTVTDTHTTLGVTFALLAWSNLIVAVFNVLPGLPLDGGRLVAALVWMLGGSRFRGTVVAGWSGRVVAVLLALAVLFGNAALSGHTGTVTLSGIAAAAMGFALAAFLWMGASQSLRVASVQDRARHLTAAGLLRQAVYVADQVPLSEALRRLAASGARAIVVIDSAGRSRAIVSEPQVAKIAFERRPWTPLAEVSRPLEPGLILSDGLDGEGLIEAMRAMPSSEYLVVDQAGVARGVLASSDVLGALGLTKAGSRTQ
ncbi:site-2 protease family protein [Jatrophihabitans telluris]|uniref:Zinc metalloprotease n=1 Tax=Jatrophihabitans telluris TaxID=2038343 RepID=A0ABY4QS28_9ACTN|nr:site-2 protease family protein [Jatrophihabitans telluris]UQX86645.1 site-2 protease family protein [Jatrophihabitans telluris]